MQQEKKNEMILLQCRVVPAWSLGILYLGLVHLFKQQKYSLPGSSQIKIYFESVALLHSWSVYFIKDKL